MQATAHPRPGGVNAGIAERSGHGDALEGIAGRREAEVGDHFRFAAAVGFDDGIAKIRAHAGVATEREARAYLNPIGAALQPVEVVAARAPTGKLAGDVDRKAQSKHLIKVGIEVIGLCKRHLVARRRVVSSGRVVLEDEGERPRALVALRPCVHDALAEGVVRDDGQHLRGFHARQHRRRVILGDAQLRMRVRAGERRIREVLPRTDVGHDSRKLHRHAGTAHECVDAGQHRAVDRRQHAQGALPHHVDAHLAAMALLRHRHLDIGADRGQPLCQAAQPRLGVIHRHGRAVLRSAWRKGKELFDIAREGEGARSRNRFGGAGTHLLDHYVAQARARYHTESTQARGDIGQSGAGDMDPHSRLDQARHPIDQPRGGIAQLRLPSS